MKMRQRSRLFSAVFVCLGTVVAAKAETYTVLHNFAGAPTDGGAPVGALIEDPVTGALYGTTQVGGTHLYGTVFTIAKDGTGYALLHSIWHPTTGAAAPPTAR